MLSINSSKTNNEPIQYAEVVGIIKSFTFPKNYNDPIYFSIYCPNNKMIFNAQYNTNIQIRNGDVIHALCEYRNNTLFVIKPPFVQPFVNKDDIITCFIRTLKCGSNIALNLYNDISKLAEGNENVVSYLTDISQKYNDEKSIDILIAFNRFEPELIRKLLLWWFKERNLRRLYLLGITKYEINATRLTCEEIYQKCINNPYTVPAISLDKCSAILSRLNRKPTEDDIIRGSIVRTVWRNLHDNGFIGVPTRIISKQHPNIKDHIEVLKQDYDIVIELNTIYLKFPNEVEKFMTDFIEKLKSNDDITYDTPLDEPIEKDGKIVERLSAHFSVALSEDQCKAVQGALDHTISVITGIAGCGKTTCLGQIIHNLELRGLSYAVCSFTGKAVSRIREVIKKRNPVTIHKLISNTRTDMLNKKYYEKELILEREYEHIIIDEASMVTTELIHDLLRCYPTVKKLTLIGDINQLPPISWGCLFQQLLKSETVPTYYLTTNYRVYTVDGEKDGVIYNSNAIIKHDPIYPFEYEQTNNFAIFEGPVERVYDIVKSCFANSIKQENLIIITPFNRDIPKLNIEFQNIYNIGSRFVVDSRGVKWMINDRVMLTENDQDIGVFNGETGIIRDVNDKVISVEFGYTGCFDFELEPKNKGKGYYKGSKSSKYYRRGKEVDQIIDGNEEYIDDQRTVLKLLHANAITVDKSQGSEWDFVIFYIPEFNTGSFLNKNRIYTAITRAKRCVWCVVSDIDAFNTTSTKSLPYRCDNLGQRLKEKLPYLAPYKINHGLKELEGIPEEQFDNGFDCDDY